MKKKHTIKGDDVFDVHFWFYAAKLVHAAKIVDFLTILGTTGIY